jgi:hypothetical protein
MNMMSAIVAKSDQVNADDFSAGETMDITIRDVKFSGGAEQPVSIYFNGNDKAFRPCKSMCRVLVAIWGPDAKEYIGRSMRLYKDPEVTYGKLKVGGIRISHMSHMEAPIVLALTATRANKKPYQVRPMPIEQKQTPAPDELTPEAAEHSLRTAATLDDLKAVWANKAMRPFREKLQPVLDERKAELTPANTDVAEVTAMYATATNPADLTAADMAANKLGLSEDLTVANAKSDAETRIDA